MSHCEHCLSPELGDYFVTVNQIADYWLRNGGDPSAVVKMTAIAWCESDYGNAYVCSYACCDGLWQICENHDSEVNVRRGSLMDGDSNARWAIELSNNGQSVSAWDCAYPSVAAAAERYPISDIQPGAFAEPYVAYVAAQLGISGGGGSGGIITQTAPDLSQPSPIGGDVGTVVEPPPPAATDIPPEAALAVNQDLPYPIGPTLVPQNANPAGGAWSSNPIQQPNLYGSGWDNLAQYAGYDQGYFTDVDRTVLQVLSNAFQ